MSKKRKGSDGVRGGFFGRRRQWRVCLGIFVAFLICVFLVSCMAGSGVLFAGGVLLPTAAAEEETATRTLSTDGALAGRLCETVLSVTERTPRITPFSGEREALARTREAMLLGMLRASYSAYVGNEALIARAAAAYPNTAFLTLIPAEDLEARASRTYGGTIGHESVGAFVYLERVRMYTTAMPCPTEAPEISVSSLVETENTYRMRFTLSDGDVTSPAYVAVFEKRDGGGCVWRALYE